MTQLGQIVLVISPEDGEYAFGRLESRNQEGYWVSFGGKDDIRRVPIGHMHFLTFPVKGSPAQIKEELDNDPIMRNLVESLVRQIQRLTRENEVLPTF